MSLHDCIAGLFQENQARLGGGIFVAGNGGAASLKLAQAPEGFCGTSGKP